MVVSSVFQGMSELEQPHFHFREIDSGVMGTAIVLTQKQPRLCS